MVPVLHPLWLLLISALRIYMLLLLLLLLMLLLLFLLLLLLRYLHYLSPCLVAAWLILYHCVGSCYVAAAPATYPLLKTSVVGLLKCSLLLVLCLLLGVGLMCLPLLCWGRLGCLPLLRGGRWGSTHVTVLVLSHGLICLHLRVLWLLHLHRVNRWSALAHGRHLELQRIHRSSHDVILGSYRRIVFSFLCLLLGQPFQRSLKVFEVVCEARWYPHPPVRS